MTRRKDDISLIPQIFKKANMGLSTIRRGLFWMYMLILAKPANGDSSALCEGNATQIYFRTPQNNLFQLSIVSPHAEILKFLEQHKLPSLPHSAARIKGLEEEVGERSSHQLESQCHWKKTKPKPHVSYGRMFMARPFRVVEITSCNTYELAGMQEDKNDFDCIKTALSHTGEWLNQLENKSIPRMSSATNKIFGETLRAQMYLNIAARAFTWSIFISVGLACCRLLYRQRRTRPEQVPENNTNLERLEAIGAGGMEIPPQFCCSISMNIMTNPVIISSGSIYEYHAIAVWINTKIFAGHPLIDPCKPHLLITQTLTPANELRQAIESFITEQETLYHRRTSEVVISSPVEESTAPRLKSR